MLQLAGIIEMVLDRSFTAASYKDNFLDAGRDHLFHNVLDDRLVDNGQHFFGLGDGRRQKARTKTSHRYDRLTDFLPSALFWHGKILPYFRLRVHSLAILPSCLIAGNYIWFRAWDSCWR